jgi:hypothetical protein
MIAAVLAAALAVQATPETAPRSGQWVILDVQRVIAPDITQGQCFVQGRVSQVVRGRLYKPGQQLNVSLPCVKGPANPLIPLQATPGLGKRPPITVERLESLKRALVHLDASARVVDNDYYAVGVQPLSPR